MEWQLIGNYGLEDRWKASAPVTKQLFRVKSNVSNLGTARLRAAIGQGYLSAGKLNVYDPQLLSYRQESELFLFDFPFNLERRILIRRLDREPIPWGISLEQFNGEINTQTYLIDAIRNVSTEKFNFVPVFHNPSVTKDLATLILGANLNRELVTIYNPTNKPIFIGLEVDENSNLTNIITSIEKEESKTLPLQLGNKFYTGNIYCLSEQTGNIFCTEFVKGELINGSS